MQLFGIIVAGLSVASVQAIAVPGLPAAGLLFARQDHPPESPCLHPGGKKKCQIDCASKNADFWSCAPTCVCHFISTTALPPTATPTGPSPQTSDQPTTVPTPSG
ncbi:hypothetical protein NCS57_00211800 [Fusarium keratoplasticum]|uniref:Uncharacterized protein n=1 Tax=Fusarium keratoplasticum TaxID=1328300 RepID=A0ACC0R7Q9_9HYPO|nr:hypothetical protein NCS57_00211800 [Fusarium keratoplasticum]KAI8679339.1 hypothetical protein NCS57_00211800 [Fusarium keratoplasticum]KAI8685435.1 hypothetical protein NCS55_00215800 [Fusarium keratoplasticum]